MAGNKYLYRRRVSSRGQTVLPKELREQLGLRAGDTVEYVKMGEQWIVRPAVPPDNPYAKAIGALKHHQLVDLPSPEFLDEVRGKVDPK